MSTNFYVSKKRIHSDNPKTHIGKRSAAGLYCWDCGITLYKGGIKSLHSGNGDWYKECPKCGKEWERESLNESSGGRELGFNDSEPGKKTGVKTCCSFSWAQDPEEFLKKKVNVWDEYGTKYTHKEFLKVLEECPIQYKTSIGVWFC